MSQSVTNANVTIPNLGVATLPLSQSDLLVVGQGGIAKQVTLSNFSTGVDTLTTPVTLQPSFQFVIPPYVLAGQTAQVAPLVEFNAVSVSGTIGNGGTVNSPPLHMFAWLTADTMQTNAAGLPVVYEFVENYNTGAGGGRVNVQALLNINGPIIPGINPITGNPANPFFVNVVEALKITSPVVGSTAAAPKGQFFSGNPKVTAATGVGPISSVVSLGEADIGINPSSETITFGGTVTGGETISVTIDSTIGGYNQVVSYVANSADTPGLVLNGVAAAIMSNTTLTNNGVGVGLPGASSTGTSADLLGLCWPLSDSDITVTPSITGSSGLTISQSTPITGASSKIKTSLAIVSLVQDGASGLATDAAISLGKQSRNGAWSSGGWSTILSVGGTANYINDGSGIGFNSQWPLAYDANWFSAVVPTSAGGQADEPLTQPVSNMFASLANVLFTSGALSFAGLSTFANGSAQIGSAMIQRLTGSAAAAGIQFSATGWEATAITLHSGGGSGTPGGLQNRYYAGIDIGSVMGGFLQVDTVDNTGAVVTFHVWTDGNGHTCYPVGPPGAAPATIQPVTGCSGSGWNVSITWSPANTIGLGGANNRVVITQSATANAGAYLVDNWGTVAAAGTSQATATVLPAQVSYITGGTTNEGVVAPLATASGVSLIGAALTVINRSGTGLNLYPATGAQIESAGTNNPVTLANNVTNKLRYISATQAYIE